LRVSLRVFVWCRSLAAVRSLVSSARPASGGLALARSWVSLSVPVCSSLLALCFAFFLRTSTSRLNTIYHTPQHLFVPSTKTQRSPPPTKHTAAPQNTRTPTTPHKEGPKNKATTRGRERTHPNQPAISSSQVCQLFDGKELLCRSAITKGATLPGHIGSESAEDLFPASSAEEQFPPEFPVSIRNGGGRRDLQSVAVALMETAASRRARISRSAFPSRRKAFATVVR